VVERKRYGDVTFPMDTLPQHSASDPIEIAMDADQSSIENDISRPPTTKHHLVKQQVVTQRTKPRKETNIDSLIERMRSTLSPHSQRLHSLVETSQNEPSRPLQTSALLKLPMEILTKIVEWTMKGSSRNCVGKVSIQLRNALHDHFHSLVRGGVVSMQISIYDHVFDHRTRSYGFSNEEDGGTVWKYVVHHGFGVDTTSKDKSTNLSPGVLLFDRYNHAVTTITGYVSPGKIEPTNGFQGLAMLVGHIVQVLTCVTYRDQVMIDPVLGPVLVSHSCQLPQSDQETKTKSQLAFELVATFLRTRLTTFTSPSPLMHAYKTVFRHILASLDRFVNTDVSIDIDTQVQLLLQLYKVVGVLVPQPLRDTTISVAEADTLDIALSRIINSKKIVDVEAKVPFTIESIHKYENVEIVKIISLVKEYRIEYTLLVVEEIISVMDSKIYTTLGYLCRVKD
jgi:hypothetical protein